MNEEFPEINIKEESVLEKFEGAPEPQNLVERILLVDGEIIKKEFFENGEVVKSIDVQGGELDAAN